jgi:hypothetical protein
MNENIITPNFTNGVTIVILALVFFGGLWLLTQGVKWGVSQSQSSSSSGGY